MSRNREAMRYALEQVYGGDQEAEAAAVLDKLSDVGFLVRDINIPVASTTGLAKRRSA